MTNDLEALVEEYLAEVRENVIDLPGPSEEITDEDRVRYEGIGISNRKMQDWYHQLVIKEAKKRVAHFENVANQEVYLVVLRVEDRIRNYLERCGSKAKEAGDDRAKSIWNAAAWAISQKLPHSHRSANQLMVIQETLSIGAPVGELASKVITEC